VNVLNTLYIVVPCYNEEAVLPETAKRLANKLDTLLAQGVISAQSRILLVDDGSKDGTWALIDALHRSDGRFDGLRLSRNRGHQNALLAGLMTARLYADMAVSMDADLQDDMDAVDKMVDEYHAGCDIVYGVRSARKLDTAFKRGTAQGYYRLINSLGGELVYNHADYRLMSRRALDSLAEYGEVNLFLRGIIPMLGYKTAVVEYERAERFAGESKYPLKKMLELAVEGVTSLTTRPLRAVTFLGFGILAVDIILLLVFLIGAFQGISMLDWKILLFTILLIGGLIIVSLGVVGEYVGKIYMETKRRPRYFIDRFLHEDAGSNV
jgi:glycosyltransferase involved in cell wall biosynthesis